MSRSAAGDALSNSIFNPRSWLPATKERLGETAKKMALFAVIITAIGAAIYGISTLFNLPIDFTAHLGGIAIGATIPFLVAAGAYFYFRRRGFVLRGCDNFDKLYTALTVITTAVVIILGTTTHAFEFTAQWRGMIAGCVVSALALKIMIDQRLRTKMEEDLQNHYLQPAETIAKTAERVKEVLKTVLTLLVVTAVIGGALYGGAHLFGANPELASQTPGLVAGGISTLLIAGTLYALFNRKKFTQREGEILFALAVIAALTLFFLDQNNVIQIKDYFQPWQGVVGGFVLTASAFILTALSRKKTALLEKLESSTVSFFPHLILDNAAPTAGEMMNDPHHRRSDSNRSDVHAGIATARLGGIPPVPPHLREPVGSAEQPEVVTVRMLDNADDSDVKADTDAQLQSGD